jgi:hypothetical protein
MLMRRGPIGISDIADKSISKRGAIDWLAVVFALLIKGVGRASVIVLAIEREFCCADSDDERGLRHRHLALAKHRLVFTAAATRRCRPGTRAEGGMCTRHPIRIQALAQP